MKKNGFTLVELLAVIAILAILVIIALPNVMGMFNDAKKKAFTTELKEVYKVAQQTWMSDSLFSTGEKSYARCKSNCPNKLDLSGREELDYFIKVNKAGYVIEYYATDGTYQYSYKGTGLRIEDINNVTSIADINNGKYVQINCNSGKVASPIPDRANMLPHGAHGMTSEASFYNTSITKKDIEKLTFVTSISGHTPNGTDCWDVSIGKNGSVLAWANDADGDGLYEITIGANGDIFTEDGAYFFADFTNLERIEGIENFNTSNLTSFEGLFRNCLKLQELDVGSFDTSNVTNMNNVFSATYSGDSYAFTAIQGLNNWDTSRVTTMRRMFSNLNNLTTIDVSNFNTKNVTNMETMFGYNVNITSLNLSNFDTSKVTNMERMFVNALNLKTLDISSFDTSNVTNMDTMFGYNFKLETVYVSNKFNTNNVTNDTNMFVSCAKLVGGAGTVFDSSHITKEYAHIDGGSSNPGYFTQK